MAKKKKKTWGQKILMLVFHYHQDKVVKIGAKLIMSHLVDTTKAKSQHQKNTEIQT
jgi:hypothetical protein